MTSNTQLRDAAGEADPAFEDPQGPGKRYSRIFGALFLAGFLVYGIGFGLVSSVTTAPDFMSTLAANSTILVVGAFLMLLNTVVDIGKGVLFFPIAERRGKRTALVYLAAITVQVVLLDLGVLFLLMLVPLSEFVAGTAAIEGTAVGSLLTQANTLAYELGQGTLAFGALFMTWFLFRTRMVPRTLALWGVVGYCDPPHWSDRRDLRDPCRACAVDPSRTLRSRLRRLADRQGVQLHRHPAWPRTR